MTSTVYATPCSQADLAAILTALVLTRDGIPDAGSDAAMSLYGVARYAAVDAATIEKQARTWVRVNVNECNRALTPREISSRQRAEDFIQNTISAYLAGARFTYTLTTIEVHGPACANPDSCGAFRSDTLCFRV